MEMRKIQQLRNCHKGERCFVIGTGASLKYEDLELISNEFSFASNSIILTYKKTSWRPNVYGIVDYFGYKEDIAKYSSKNFDDYAKEFVFLNSRICAEGNKRISLLVSHVNHRKRRIEKKEIKQEEELSICFRDCFTVTNMLISLAIYMGFREIYLLGVDCDYSGEKIHIEETLADQIRKMDSSHLRPRADLMLCGYELMNRVAKKNQCQIYNATRGGKLEIFPRMQLEEVMGGK
ncbi:MAG: DUF115 domain-containing protein [Lachnospiraceae bacterium]|nr:DUF115 domain-containing protein [Lachnospiraceae bacterium]